MDKFIEMSFEDWEKTYKPIPNNFDDNASFQDESGRGIMFETYGEEVAFVKKADPAHIWTYGDGDDGGGYIWRAGISLIGLVILLLKFLAHPTRLFRFKLTSHL